MLVCLIDRSGVNTSSRWILYLLGLTLIFSLFSFKLYGQDRSSVPDEITFANLPIHLTAQTRYLIQRELIHLYVSPHQRLAEEEALRRLSPLLKPFLRKASLPEDFGLLALPFGRTDSLGYWALSTVRASQINLRQDRLVDERYHPLNSTEAVVAKLQALQQSQPQALLTLLRYLEWASYTPVPQSFDPTFVQPDEKSPPILWKLLARKLVMTTQSPGSQPPTDSIEYVYQPAGGQTLQAIGQRLPVTLEQLKNHNRWLKTDWVPADKDYSVLVPLTAEGFLQAEMVVESGRKTPLSAVTGFPVLAKAPAKADPLRSVAQYYLINQRLGVQAQNCDNLITLAFYGQLTIHSLLKYNDLPSEQALIRPGQIYYLQAKSRRAKIPFHVVQPNQTLLEIANQYGIRLKSLLTFNRLKTAHRLPAGRLLWLQKKRPARQPIAYVQLPEPPPPTPPPPPVTDTLITAQARLPAPSPAPVLDSLPHESSDSLSVTEAELAAVAPLPDTLPLPSSPPVNETPPSHWHRVKAGQTYYGIARLYGVDVTQLYRWNHLSEAIALRVGQSLRIQGKTPAHLVANQLKPISAGSRASPSRQEVSHPLLRKAVFYTVQAGQTLYRIGLLNRVRVKDLVSWNNLKTITIETGQILLIWK